MNNWLALFRWNLILEFILTKTPWFDFVLNETVSRRAGSSTELLSDQMASPDGEGFTPAAWTSSGQSP